MAIKDGKITFEGETYSLSTEDRLAAELVNQNDNTLSGTNTVTGELRVSGPSVQTIQTVAAAGSDQGDATAFSGSNGRFVNVTGAGSNKVVILPPLSEVTAGTTFYIFNNHASNTLEIAPAVGDKIGPAADNALITVAADTITMCVALDSAEWVGAEFPAVGA